MVASPFCGVTVHCYMTAQACTWRQREAIGTGAAGGRVWGVADAACVVVGAVEGVVVVESVEFKFHESAGSKISNLNHSLKPNLT